MPRYYKHSNGRIVPRRGNGQFRHSTLQDFGIGKDQLATGPRRCNACGTAWNPILVTGICPTCGKQESSPVEEVQP